MQIIKNAQYKHAKVIQQATVKDFGGGLNLSDDDLNINSRYAKVLQNMYRSRDGRLRLRYGVKSVATLPVTALGNIIASEYYGGRIIVATTDSRIISFDLATLTPITLWPTGIAGKLWTPNTTVVNFAQSQNELIIVNGKDKPLRLKSDFSIDFLGDVGNANSNTNTPIAPYVAVCQNFVVMAGQPSAPTKLFISAKSSTGTFSGDPIPNDATTYDVGGFVAHGDNRIVGITALNNFLFVAFETSTIAVTLGTYNGTTHVPSVFDVFDTYGTISQKTMCIVDKELWYCDQTGVLRVGRNQLSTTFIPDRVSQRVDPQLLKTLQGARLSGAISNSFAVFNRLASQYMLFISSGSGSNKETWVSTRYNPQDDPSWSVFTGLNFNAAVITSTGKLYLFTDKTVYLYGDINDEFFNDNGDPIVFDWETPWSVFQEYDQIKKAKAIRIYAEGGAFFDLSFFVDRIYKKSTGAYDPSAMLTFSSGVVGGFGNQTGDQGYGGSDFFSVRETRDPRIWTFNSKYIQGKFRISGSTTEDLQIIGLSISYTVGGRKR